jgi:hypothetical protein
MEIDLARRGQFVMALPGKIAFEVALTPADRATVERICRDDLTDASWRSDAGGKRTRQAISANRMSAPIGIDR